jgi:hypothetical protein
MCIWGVMYNIYIYIYRNYYYYSVIKAISSEEKGIMFLWRAISLGEKGIKFPREERDYVPLAME